MTLKRILSSITFKLVVPIILVFSIIVTAAFIRLNKINIENVNKEAQLEINNMVIVTNNKIEAASNAAVYSSALFSNFASVKQAYRNYYKNNNIDSANHIIKQSISSSIANIESLTGIKPMLHFHLPPAISLYRSWTNKYGDDISSFRKSIVDISLNHRVSKLIEVGNSGIVIRGIAPIFDKGDKYLGSVETIFPLSIIINRIVKNNTEGIALYINKNALAFDSLYSNYSNTKGDFILLNSSDNYRDKLFDNNDFIFDNKDIKYKEAENCICALLPINNSLGQTIGVISLQKNITKVTAIIDNELNKNIKYVLIVLSIFTIIIYFGIRWIVIKPIEQISKDIEELSKGKIVSILENTGSGVISAIYSSFNLMLDRLKKTTTFANEMGEGNLDVTLEGVTEDDVLGQSLIRMRDNLIKSKELEERNRIEENKRAWATKGHAEFAEILRNNNSDIEKFTTEIISNLVKYTNSNQGSLFIINNEDSELLDLMATYAYDRKKYISKSIKIGEGLVGTCAIEKETIFLTDIPDNYINIRSGLGGANPKSIIIVPLKIENKIFGVIELASFNIYENYQIKFVEKLGESIASTISVTKTNIITNKLLEQSKLQAEELAAAEEEMRQNLEEMTATQEQLSENSKENKRKNNELRAQMDAIDKFALVSKTDPKGIIIYVNDLFCEVAGYSRERLIGKPHNIVRHPDMPKSVFENLWKTIKAGNVWSGKITNLAKDGSSYLVDANISPIYDENGDLKEYIGIRYLINRKINNKN